MLLLKLLVKSEAVLDDCLVMGATNAMSTWTTESCETGTGGSMIDIRYSGKAKDGRMRRSSWAS